MLSASGYGDNGVSVLACRGWKTLNRVDLEVGVDLEKLKVALELGPLQQAGVWLPDVQGINVMMRASPPSPSPSDPCASLSLQGFHGLDPLFTSA